MGLRQIHDRVVTKALGLQTVRFAVERGGPNHRRTGRQQHRECRAHDPLVSDQVFVGASVIMRVLMNIYDRLGRGVGFGRV